MKKPPLTLLVAVIAGFAVLCGVVVVSNRSGDNQNVGWTPTNLPPVPFHAGIITTGQPPPEFEIDLTDLELNSKPVSKPLADRQFEVRIKPSHDGFDDFPIPTFVFLELSGSSNGARRISSDFVTSYQSSMNAYAIENKVYVYRGSLTVPAKVGDYKVYARADYSVYQKQAGQLVAMKPFQKKSAEVEIHVRR